MKALVLGYYNKFFSVSDQRESLIIFSMMTYLSYKIYRILPSLNLPHYRLLSLYSKGFEPGSDSRSCSVIVRVRVVLKRTVVGDSD